MEQEQVNPVRFFELMDRVRRAWRNISPCPQLSKSQFATLMVLKHAGKPPLVQFTEEEVERGMSLSALAGVMGQSLPAVSQRISTLEAMGYVEQMCIRDRPDRGAGHHQALHPHGGRDALLHQRAGRGRRPQH